MTSYREVIVKDIFGDCVKGSLDAVDLHEFDDKLTLLEVQWI